MKLNSKVSNTVDQQTIRPWQIVSRSKQPNLNLSLPDRPIVGDLTDFPPLPLKNRFTPLENDLDKTSIICNSHSTPRSSTGGGVNQCQETSSVEKATANRPRPTANLTNKNASSLLQLNQIIQKSHPKTQPCPLGLLSIARLGLSFLAKLKSIIMRIAKGEMSTKKSQRSVAILLLHLL